MSSWSYRLLRLNAEDVEIAEVYYDDAGVPRSYALRTTGGTCVDEITHALEHQYMACIKSVLSIEASDDGGPRLVDTGELLPFHATDREE